MKLAALVLSVLMIAAPALSQEPAHDAEGDALTRAKLAADLGNAAEAEQLLGGVAADAAASGARRGEAFVRLAAILRGRGDAAAAADAFRSALVHGGSDVLVLGLLARTLEGVSADDAVVRAALGKASLVENGGSLRLDLGTTSPECAIDSAVPVTLSLQDGELIDAAWLIAQQAGMQVVLSRCLEGTAHRVSLDLKNVPAGEALSSLVRMQGLRCARQGSVLIIGCADAPPLAAATCDVAAGVPLSIEVRQADGNDVLRLFGEVFGTAILPQPCALGTTISLRLTDVGAGDVLCAIARVNDWTVEKRDDGVHVGCINDPGTAPVASLTGEWPLKNQLISLAQDAGRNVVVWHAVEGSAPEAGKGDPAVALDALIASKDLRVIDVGGVSLIVPVSDVAAASQPAGVPSDFPSSRIRLPGNQAGAREVAPLIFKETGRLLIPGCRSVDRYAGTAGQNVPAAAFLDAWCRASGLKLRASGPALFAWEPPCEGPKGEIIRASSHDGKIELEVKDLLAPHVVAALNLLTAQQVRLDVRLRERVLSLGGTWASPADAARALAAQLGTEATWSEPHGAWLVGPSDAVVFGDGFRGYAVRADAMPLGAWLDLVRPLVGWPVAVADGVDLSRSVPLRDLHETLGWGQALVDILEQRTPYHVGWDDKGLVIKP